MGKEQNKQPRTRKPRVSPPQTLPPPPPPLSPPAVSPGGSGAGRIFPKPVTKCITAPSRRHPGIGPPLLGKSTFYVIFHLSPGASRADAVCSSWQGAPDRLQPVIMMPFPLGGLRWMVMDVNTFPLYKTCFPSFPTFLPPLPPSPPSLPHSRCKIQTKHTFLDIIVLSHNSADNGFDAATHLSARYFRCLGPTKYLVQENVKAYKRYYVICLFAAHNYHW